MRRRGLTAAEIDHATRMAAYFASGADGTATDHVLRLTGHAPRSIEAFLDEHAGAFSHHPPRPRTVPHEGTEPTMVTRIGHIALHVADLDAAVDFQQQVIGMVETERVAGASYLTCNERHHELILIEDRANRGYAHLALEVPDPACSTRGEAADRRRRHAARRRLRRRARHRPRAAGALARRPRLQALLRHGDDRPRRRPATGPSSSSTSPARSPTTAPRSASSPTASACASRPHGLPRLLVALRRRPPRHRPRPARRAPSSPTTPTSGATSPRSAASPTASRPPAGASASGAPAATAPATTTSSTSTTRTAR